MANVGVGAVRIIDSDGDIVESDGSGSLKVKLTGSDTINANIGDIDLEFNGTAASVDNGTADSGTLRVTLASDSTVVQREDDGHNSGDYGVMALAVRKSTGGTIAGADDDYTPLQVNDAGALRVSAAIASSVALTVGHDITGLQSDNNEGVDSTTAEILGSSQACKRVDMQADSANTGYIYVGGTDVSATKGIRLGPGDFYSIDIDNVSDIYVLASVDEEDIHYTYYT